MRTQGRAILGALGLSLAALVLQASDGGITAQRHVWQGLDERIGQVWFNVTKTDEEHIAVRPLIPAEMIAVRTRGDANLPLGLVRCTVLKRHVIADSAVGGLMHVFTITVLECGKREYAVDQVIFELEQPQSTSK